ncbi:hypothetical protein niasHT_018822 [Heterodera trifolii]|uniref:Uncharacterized protein n=1 Tax=Heterodera trifolii TaxID=157864 RepID=A0ABD2L3E9_9BILA
MTSTEIEQLIRKLFFSSITSEIPPKNDGTDNDGLAAVDRPARRSASAVGAKRSAETDGGQKLSDEGTTSKKKRIWEGADYVTRYICGMIHTDPFMTQCDLCDVAARRVSQFQWAATIGKRHKDEYIGDFVYQAPQSEEKIDVIANVVRRCIESFKKNRNKPPQRVVILRNGCTNGMCPI